MKCTECPKYSECVMTSDLRRKRRNCTYARDKKQMTNFEYIKQMSVEELSHLLGSIHRDLDEHIRTIDGENILDSFEDIKEWLESEVKE